MCVFICAHLTFSCLPTELKKKDISFPPKSLAQLILHQGIIKEDAYGVVRSPQGN